MPQSSPALRHGLILLIGAVLGLLLGPGVLGQLHAPTHERLFLYGDAYAEQVEERQAQEDNHRRLRDAGVTDTAIAELDAAFNRRETARRQVHLQRMTGWLHGLVLTLALVMLLETIVPADASRFAAFRRGLPLARYALLSTWVMLAIAQPRLLAEVSPLFVAVLTLLTLAACVPLPLACRSDGRRRT